MMGSKSGLIESTQINNNWHSLSNGENVGGNFVLRVWLCPTLPYIKGTPYIPKSYLTLKNGFAL